MVEFVCSSTFFRLTLLSLQLTIILSYPSGAPSQACPGLLPIHHGTAPQTTVSPFDIGVNTVKYSPNSPITVSIQSKGSDPFLAFLVQARVKGQNSSSVGQFVQPPQSSKLLTCFSSGDSVTHINAVPRTLLQFTWMPPSSNVGEIEILATVAKSKLEYWGVMSSGPLAFSGTANPATSTTVTSAVTSSNGATTSMPEETPVDTGSSAPTNAVSPLTYLLLTAVSIISHSVITNRK